MLLLLIDAAARQTSPTVGDAYAHVLALLAVVVQLHGFVAVQADQPIWAVHIASWAVLGALEVGTAIHGGIGLRAAHDKVVSALGVGLAVAKALATAIPIFWFVLHWRRAWRVADQEEGSTYTDNEAGADTSNEDAPPPRLSGIHQDAMDEIKELGGYLPWLWKFAIFLPFAWPGRSLWLQARFFTGILCVLASSYLRYLIPPMHGDLMNALQSGAPVSEVHATFAAWVSLRVVTSPLVLGSVRKFIWLGIHRVRTERLQVAAHEKVMRLDAAYHSAVAAAETIKAVDYAANVDTLLDGLLFGLLPNTLNLFLAARGLVFRYGPWVTLIVVCVAILYVIVEEREVALLTHERDKFVTMKTKKDVRRQDAIHGWSTAANHNRVAFEVDAYKQAVVAWLEQWRLYWLFSLAIRFSRSTILQAGYVVASLLVVNDVAAGRRLIGDVTALEGFWNLLLAAVDFFATFVSNQLDMLLDANRFRRIMERQPGAEDGKEALKMPKGDIELCEATFSYPGSEKKVLDKTNLCIKGGSKVGIVGASGTGKSTLFQLLMRQERLVSGAILIGGDEINTLTTDS